MSDTWTIGELAERAADALRARGQPLNGRVREVPGERLIRWYTTIGLVDPPLTRRGRIARYGRRHLLQLVAVKRLQAAGMSIADIQAALTGATDAMLEEAAGSQAPQPATPRSTPDGAPPAAPVAAPDAAPDGVPARFWARGPEHAVAGATGDAGRRGNDDGAGTPVRGVRLGRGVTLLLDGPGRTPAKDDIQAVLAAAGPLLAVLEERKLI
ncbi:helix-turn-helix domain-containing protein [Nonomuraea sp. LPB2021202275-12-8]|uniref:helix-turn-helix domain-containing protein n=1 Tax=Nonomuraea sp. LPB2021202275-12-8 TaxID=3120159 RepID=UPI00300D79D7